MQCMQAFKTVMCQLLCDIYLTSVKLHAGTGRPQRLLANWLYIIITLPISRSQITQLFQQTKYDSHSAINIHLDLTRQFMVGSYQKMVNSYQVPNN